MVIRGGKKDYYDGLQSLDRDKETIYERNPRSIKVASTDLPLPIKEFFDAYRLQWTVYYKAGASRESTRFAPGLLVFCGKPYLIVYCYEGYNRWSDPCLLEALESRLELKMLESSRELKVLAEDEQWTKRHSIAERMAATRYQSFMEGSLGLCRDRVSVMLEDFQANCGSIDLSELCLTHNAPMLCFYIAGILGDYSGETNPHLKSMDFPKKLTAHQCYQELMMFIGGRMARLVPDPAPQTVGSDEAICAQKGFDVKTSFRQAPGRKDESRKRNRLRKRGLLT